MTKTAILREDLPKHDFFLVVFTLQEKKKIIKLSYIYLTSFKLKEELIYLNSPQTRALPSNLSFLNHL